jgi:Domain of unknown function (DUF222)
MSSTASSGAAVVSPAERLEVLFEELAELAGQRNAIDGRIVEIVAEVDRDELWGATGARSVAGLVAWKLGSSSGNAATIATVARRLAEFPRCAEGMQEGRLSLDQVGVIAARAGEGSDEHYAELASVATVNQLRTAVKLEPRPEPESRPEPEPEPERSITKTTDEQGSCYRITLPHPDAAKFDAALASHHDALIAEWKHRGIITITGPADDLIVTDSAGRRLSAGSLARPPTQPPPAVPPCPGPTGERADWWWYDPSHHRQTTEVGHRGRFEAQTGWCIRKFVRIASAGDEGRVGRGHSCREGIARLLPCS